jgi:hypothetical protein
LGSFFKKVVIIIIVVVVVVVVIVQGVLQFIEYLLMCRLKSKNAFCKASAEEYSTKNCTDAQK